jgi:hypothetical protein
MTLDELIDHLLDIQEEHDVGGAVVQILVEDGVHEIEPYGVALENGTVILIAQT